MPVRSSMSALIQRVRILINDTLPVGNGQIFDDQTIQDVMDEGRLDITNHPLQSRPTFSGSTVQYLDYYSDIGGNWETDYVLKQYLTVLETASLSEPIPGHFQFASNVFPPVFITGKNYDVYRAAADLLERLAAQWVLSYSITVDGQSLQRNQATRSILLLAKEYRRKQRPRTIPVKRKDLSGSSGDNTDPLAPTNLDYYSSGTK